MFEAVEAHDPMQSRSPKDSLSEGHQRLLAIMAFLGVSGSLICSLFISLRTGLGLLAGVALAFVSFFWLRHSLFKVFENTPAGEKPSIWVFGYIVRYFVLGGVIAIIHISGMLPIAPVIIGMAVFGFAVVADGVIRLFSGFFNRLL